ncbi:MAG: substrate-binding domain-containing protein, partial [Pseudomonadales bacterium]
VCAPNEVECAVVEGRFHAGVVPRHHALPSLHYRDLYSERSLFYCAAQHPLFDVAEADLSVELVARQDFISPSYSHSELLNHQFPQHKAAASSYQVEGVATLILSGRYTGFLPDHYAASWSANGQMRALMPDTLHYQIPFSLISRIDAANNVLSTALLEAFSRAVARVGAGGGDAE